MPIPKMYNRVLLVEDLDTVSRGIANMLEEDLGVNEVVLAQYCYDAYLKFQNALKTNPKFDLLITDLSFNNDHRQDELKSGEDLIRKIRSLDKKIPIIVCSVEDKPNKVKRLLKNEAISAYVLKGRNGLNDLMEAITSIKFGEPFISPKLKDSLNGNGILEISEYDVQLLENLSKGLSQNQIANHFQIKGINPSGLSSIEKRLNKLKDDLQAKNTIQLVANAKDLGLI